MDTQNTTTAEKLGLRVGSLTCSVEYVKDIYANKDTRRFLGEFIIIDATTDWDQGIIHYLAISDHFEELDEKALEAAGPPEYVIYIENKASDPNDENSVRVYTFRVEKKPV
jgi:hypothetical protein